MGNSFVLFYVSIVIPHGQFHCGNRGHTQNTDFPWVKSHFPVCKSSSGTATNANCCYRGRQRVFSLLRQETHAELYYLARWFKVASHPKCDRFGEINILR